MKNDLKTSVNEFIESKNLTDQQLNDLLKLAQKGSKTRPVRLAWMASMVLLIVTGLGFYWTTTLKEPANLSLQIAKEVVGNHLKMKPLEVSSHSVLDLRMHFSELEFSIRKPDFIANSSLKILGGRYCSIQGITAAQLRLQDRKTGQFETLYQAPYDSELFANLPQLAEGKDPVRHYINGIAVDIWVDRGILYARTYSEP